MKIGDEIFIQWLPSKGIGKVVFPEDSLGIVAFPCAPTTVSTPEYYFARVLSVAQNGKSVRVKVIENAVSQTDGPMGPSVLYFSRVLGEPDVRYKVRDMPLLYFHLWRSGKRNFEEVCNQADWADVVAEVEYALTKWNGNPLMSEKLTECLAWTKAQREPVSYPHLSVDKGMILLYERVGNGRTLFSWKEGSET